MILDEPFERLDDNIIAELKQKLKTLSEEAYKKLGPGQLFIQFIDRRPRGSQDVPLLYPTVWIGLRVDFLAMFRPESQAESPMGLTRWVPLIDRVVLYPTDDDTLIHYVSTDPDVLTELVGPIHHNGKVAGVVLIDRIEGAIYNQEDRRVFTDFLGSIDREIRSATLSFMRRNSEAEAIISLTAIANNCYVASPLTARGYIAVKRWDGLLEYFKFGEGTELFLDLSPHEGLCGKVFRTGQLENPQQSLLKDGSYIPSDSNISSELVFPVKENDETIGVINLESYVPEAYDEAVIKELEREAPNIVRRAEVFTKPPDPQLGYAIAELFGLSLAVRPPVLPEVFDEEIRRTLDHWAKKILNAELCQFWLSRDTARPPLLDGLSWDDVTQEPPTLLNHTSVMRNTTGKPRLLYAPLLLHGEPQFIIALALKIEPSSQSVKILKALCRVASEAVRRARFEYRVRHFVTLIETLTWQDSSESLLNQVVHDAPFILQSNHCSLFYYLQQAEILVPGPSTAKTIHVRGHRVGYLPKVSEGLTGYVAATGETLRILNVRDDKELNDIHPELTWKSFFSEEIELDCRSYLAVPMFDPSNPGKVIGVLRTHRDSKSHRSGFSDEDVNMFKTLAYLSAKHLAAFLDKKTVS